MTSPPRWEPDTQMVAAVLCTPKASRRMTELSNADRAYLVAGLTLAGMTALEIAERLDCSLRLVRSIRAEDMTQVCVVWAQETRVLTDDLRGERCDHALTRAELTKAIRVIARLQMQHDEMLSHLQTKGRIDTLPCGHPKLEWNVYRYVDRSGSKPRPRTCCKLCAADRASKYRASKDTSPSGRSHNGVTQFCTPTP